MADAPRVQVQKSKAGTGRVVGFRELGLVNAFTMEASFAGAAVGKYAKQHFNTGVCALATTLQTTPGRRVQAQTCVDSVGVSGAQQTPSIAYVGDPNTFYSNVSLHVESLSCARATGTAAHAQQHVEFNCRNPAGHLEEMGAAVVRTLLDYWAPAELNSAADLCAQLDAALLQGVTDSSISSSSNSTSAAAAGAGSALDKLGLFEAVDDEDVCTDSDDESSDDEKPPVGAAATAAASAPPVTRPAAAAGIAADALEAGDSSSVCLADISRQLTNMLTANLFASTASSSKASSSQADSSNPAAHAVKDLLAALKASEALTPAAIPAAASLNSGGSSSKTTPQSPSSNSPGVLCSNSSSASSTKQATISAAAAVTAAAQQLLDKLSTAKAKVQARAAAGAAAAAPCEPACRPAGAEAGPDAAAAGGAALASSSTPVSHAAASSLRQTGAAVHTHPHQWSACGS